MAFIGGELKAMLQTSSLSALSPSVPCPSLAAWLERAVTSVVCTLLMDHFRLCPTMAFGMLSRRYTSISECLNYRPIIQQMAFVLIKAPNSIIFLLLRSILTGVVHLIIYPYDHTLTCPTVILDMSALADEVTPWRHKIPDPDNPTRDTSVIVLIGIAKAT